MLEVLLWEKKLLRCSFSKLRQREMRLAIISGADGSPLADNTGNANMM
jgi:hypothetical protein